MGYLETAPARTLYTYPLNSVGIDGPGLEAELTPRNACSTYMYSLACTVSEFFVVKNERTA